MSSALRCYSHQRLTTLSEEAVVSPRKRKNLNIHPTLEDPVQRLFNAVEPGTYLRPHRHAREAGWELMVVVRGAFSVLTFDERATVLERVELGSAVGCLAVEIPPHTWHTALSLVPGTIMLEIKTGPYLRLEDKDFAAWAPEEGAAGVDLFLSRLTQVRVGDSCAI